MQIAELFRDPARSEFVIATIPTVLAANESRRLLKELRKERIPCKRIIVNQIVSATKLDSFLQLKLKDQAKSVEVREPHHIAVEQSSRASAIG